MSAQRNRFTIGQVIAICGSELEMFAFDWGRADHFRLEDGVLRPYKGDYLLSAPSIEINLVVETTQVREAPEREAANYMDDHGGIPELEYPDRES